jgi:alpha-L-rhamnosidase
MPRTIIDYIPFKDHVPEWWNEWPANWIGHPQAKGLEPVVVVYKKAFSIDEATKLRIHVTADERYELFLDGKRIGRGSERGDVENWFVETYDLDLTAGEHVIVARTWWLGPNGPCPVAQVSLQPAFILAAEDLDQSVLNTGFSTWECKILDGYECVDRFRTGSTGARVKIDGAKYPWGFETGLGEGWVSAQAISQGLNADLSNGYVNSWLLRPATLPAMTETPVQKGQAKHIEAVTSEDTEPLQVCAQNHLASEETGWNAMLGGDSKLVIPANTMRRVIVDLGNYYTAYPEITLSGGKAATVRVRWAEALFTTPDVHLWLGTEKGNRNEIEGKYFVGVGDTFISDGGADRLFSTLWWEPGRYLEFFVSTADEPLTIDSFILYDSCYPFDFTGSFSSSDKRMEEVAPICVRTLQMCAHETYMDCPYYEQLMYVGDTRLEVLMTYVLTADDRLPRKALSMFDKSRKPSGITRSLYPSRLTQVIPPFSLWWIGMVYDYAMWRDDRAFVSDLMPGVRAVVDAFRRWVNADGLVESPEGWNFMDWVPGWHIGAPPDGQKGVNGSINWLYVYALAKAAELEEIMGEPELAARDRKLAQNAADAATKAFFDPNRGMFSEDIKHEHFSEHAQCLALLSGMTPEPLRAQVAQGLLTADDLARTTIYFSHYLFETYTQIGRIDKLMDRLEYWFQLQSQGFKTTPESPEPARSDSHAWGGHPLYHYAASILGIRPATAGFRTVKITPQLGLLTWAKGSVPHPMGTIDVDLQVVDGRLTGTVDSPVSGVLVFGGSEVLLGAGRTEIGSD